MVNALQGKLLGVKINGKYIRCQTDATLSITISTTDEDSCKPTESGTTNGNSWSTHKISAKSWNVSVSAKTFVDVVSNLISSSDITKIMVIGSASVEVTFQTIKTKDYDYANIFIYEGRGTITSFTSNAPIEGNSTFDLEITGNGALTYTNTSITPGGDDLFSNGVLQDTGVLIDSQTYNLS